MTRQRHLAALRTGKGGVSQQQSNWTLSHLLRDLWQAAFTRPPAWVAAGEHLCKQQDLLRVGL